MFELIQAHRIGNENDRRNRSNQYLKFEFPVVLKAQDSEVFSESKSNARVYIMITLIDPTSKKPLDWPNNFPEKSPGIKKDLAKKM